MDAQFAQHTMCDIYVCAANFIWCKRTFLLCKVSKHLAMKGAFVNFDVVSSSRKCSMDQSDTPDPKPGKVVNAVAWCCRS